MFDDCFENDDYTPVKELLNNPSFKMENSLSMLEDDQLRSQRALKILLDDLPTYCNDDVRETNYWKFMAEIGFEDALEETLSKIEEGVDDNFKFDDQALQDLLKHILEK